MASFPPAAYVRSIEIDDLFGEGNLRIGARPGADPRLLVIYGKNGTGKTTVLRVLTSMLSAESNAGHRSRLASIPFSRACVTLEGGTQIEAKKKEGLLGSFDWTLRKQNFQSSIHINVRARSGGVRVTDWPPETRQRYQQITDEIQSLVAQVTFLDDKRTFRLDDRSGRTTRIVDPSTILDEEGAGPERDPVHVGLRAITNAVRREALLLSNRGNQTAQSIYTSLVRDVATFPKAEPESIGMLQARLVDLESKSRRLSAYGLVAPAEHAELLTALTHADDRSLPLVEAVLNPYIQSLSARLVAIETLHNQLHTWVTNINSFMSPKVLSFRVGEEIDIKKGGKTPIPVPLLSSGERHLLLLMTRAFLLRATGGLMLVDEPELSLNSGWQRALIRAILEAFGDAPCQLIVASHSLEICAQYENQVVVI